MGQHLYRDLNAEHNSSVTKNTDTGGNKAQIQVAIGPAGGPMHVKRSQR